MSVQLEGNEKFQPCDPYAARAGPLPFIVREEITDICKVVLLSVVFVYACRERLECKHSRLIPVPVCELGRNVNLD